jgi:hypothetical protein
MKRSFNSPITKMTISEMKDRFGLSESEVKHLQDLENGVYEEPKIEITPEFIALQEGKNNNEQGKYPKELIELTIENIINKAKSLLSKTDRSGL